MTGSAAQGVTTVPDTEAKPAEATAAPRSRDRRRRDTEHRLAHDVDLWVASASADGVPYLVPLSFDWDGEALLVATPAEMLVGGKRPMKLAGATPEQMLKMEREMANLQTQYRLVEHTYGQDVLNFVLASS
jgi:hypothetical protein